MFDNLLTVFVDLIYLTAWRRRRFALRHPAARVWAASAVKAICLPTDQPVTRGTAWATSRRSVLFLTDKALYCGDWMIPLTTIVQAELVQLQDTGIRGYVLKIGTQDHQHYQFGMQKNSEWLSQPVLPLTVTTQVLKNSLGRLLLKIAAIAWLIFLVAWEFLR